jgi:putative effector of murein hydrolase
MKKIALGLALSFSCLALFTFCNKKTEDTTTTPVTEVSFSKEITPIFVKNCMLCHVGAKPLLTDYTQVKSAADKGTLVGTISHASGFKPMPPTSMMTTAEIDLVKKWVSQGAKNN